MALAIPEMGLSPANSFRRFLEDLLAKVQDPGTGHTHNGEDSAPVAAARQVFAGIDPAPDGEFTGDSFNALVAKVNAMIAAGK